MTRTSIFGFALTALTTLLCASAFAEPCGEIVSVETHSQTTTRYSFGTAQETKANGPAMAIVLLAGGTGNIDLDQQGCAGGLKGNSLVRSVPLFRAAGIATALVDVPSDLRGSEGLGGFRTHARHAEDLGKVIADLRNRVKGEVWIIGTSRGSISAVNAASRLAGPAAPDGVVITSVLTVGTTGGRMAWTADTVFDLPLEAIKAPALILGHEQDKCFRSPPDKMNEVATRIGSARKQVVKVSGGPGLEGPPSLAACEGRAPHGFTDQESEVVEGIARFMRGGSY